MSLLTMKRRYEDDGDPSTSDKFSACKRRHLEEVETTSRNKVESPAALKSRQRNSATVQNIPTKISQIFQLVYQRDAKTLYAWIAQLQIDNLQLFRDDDTKGYIDLLNSTLVIETSQPLLHPPSCLRQVSEMQDVILRTIERLKRRNSSNVLAFGFDSKSDKVDSVIIGPACFLDYRFPNSAFNRLQFTPWKALLSRIGDELMTRLLERTSLFVFVAPSNYVQITGAPIYDILPLKYYKLPERSTKGCEGKDKSSVVLCEYDKQSKATKCKKGKKAKGKTKQGLSDIRIPYQAEKTIVRQTMLYSSNLTERIPTSFCLHSLDSALDLSTMILNDSSIWSQGIRSSANDMGVHSQRCPASQMPKNETFIPQQIIQICQQIIAKHNKCRYKYYLDHHCKCKTNRFDKPVMYTKLKKVPVYTRDKTEPLELINPSGCGNIRLHPPKISRRNPPSIASLLADYSDHRQVFLFLRIVCLFLLPLEIFGDVHNRNVFFKHLTEFVSMGRHELYTMGRLMTGVKVGAYRSFFPGLPQTHLLRLVAQIHWWLSNSIIMPLIKAFFYVTVTSMYRNRLLYYRKGVWLHIQNCAVKAHLKRSMLTPLSQIKAATLLKSGSALGAARLRFLPKFNSLRPVVNMGAKGQPGHKKIQSINTQMRTVLSVLQYLTKKKPALFASSMFGFDDIYKAYRNFVLRRKAANENRELFFVKTDVAHCFDTIDPHVMSKIIKEILTDDDAYIARRWFSVHLGGIRCKRAFHKETFTLENYQPDFVLFTEKLGDGGLHDSILVDQVLHPHVTSEDVISLLNKHLFINIVKIGRLYYRQTMGISQGSVLSTMLCSLYAADMERSTRATPLSDELLMRLVDDSLYVTPYKERAVKFIDQAVQGNAEYRQKTNVNKLLLNFPHKSLPTVEGKDPFSWCGMLIDTKTLNVAVDYSRYAGQAVSDTLTVDFNKAGFTMKNKLVLSLQNRCHSIFMDPLLNSLGTLVHSLYNAFLLVAYKMHYYIKRTWTSLNLNFLMNCILYFPLYISKNKKFKLGTDSREECSLSKPLINWLCLKAFISHLSKHHSMYSKLLKLLKRHMIGSWRKMSDIQRKAVDVIIKAPIPVAFQQILEH